MKTPSTKSVVQRLHAAHPVNPLTPQKPMKKNLSTYLTMIAVVLLSTAGVQAGNSIGLNFVGDARVTTGIMTAGDKAGLPSVAQANWNNAPGGVGSLKNLQDASGTATRVEARWHSGCGWGTYGTRIADKGDNSRMMRGYLDVGPGEQGVTITFTNISYAWYDVIIYFDGFQKIGRVGAYTVNGVTVYGKDAAEFDGTFTEVEQTDLANVTAGNYVRFTGQVGSSFTVKAEGVAAPDGRSLRAAINGIQIVEIPDPSTFTVETKGPEINFLTDNSTH
jgi:hypothetical protein